MSQASLQFEYNFHMDGTIEIRLSASGYIQGGFWEDTQDPYGSRIRDHTSKHLPQILSTHLTTCTP